jgi:putative ABC transport system permease protein
MYLFDSILSGLQQIRDHKLRSLLTLLGIILGTMALISMFSFVDGIKVIVMKGFSQLGYDGVVFVIQKRPSNRLEDIRFARHGLRLIDIPFLNREETQFQGISPVIEWRTSAVFDREPRYATFVGVSQEYFTVRNRTATAGRLITALDVERTQGVCVLGKLIAEDVFGTPRKSLGRYITSNGCRFQVVGVLRYDESDLIQDRDIEREHRRVFLPITFLMKNFTGDDRIHYVAMKVEDTERLDDAFLEVIHLFKRIHGTVEDVRVENVAEEILRIREFLDELLRNWTIIGGSIGGVSLLVGGIGVLSILLISISERTFEIGLRKAMGAGDAEIFALFIVESLTLCAIGATLGCLLGALLVRIFEGQFEFDLIVSRSGLGLTVLFALFVGAAFGFYPAWKASRMEPVQALKGI